MKTDIRTEDIQAVRTHYEGMQDKCHDDIPAIHKIGDRYGYKGKILSRRLTHPGSTEKNLDEFIEHIQKG
jgi:hypothetical protein